MMYAMKKIFGIIFAFGILSGTSVKGQAWEQKQNYPVAAGADGGVCFAIGDTIYVGGGLNSKQFRKYVPANDQWLSAGLLPGVLTDRSFGIGFSVDGKGYVGMGIDGFTKKNDMWEYDPATGSWTQKQNFPGMASDGFYVFVINNLAYIGAGEDPFTLQQYNAAYSFNPLANVWTQLSDFPTSGVIYPFSFSINQKGYVSCGQNSLGTTTETFQYEPLLDVWTPKADYAGFDRQAGVSFVLDDIAYCGLGMNAVFLNDFYSYDPVNDLWLMADTLPAPARSFPVAAVSGNSAFVGLGWSYSLTETYYKDWWKYSLSTGQDEMDERISWVEVYPNPVTDFLYVNVKENEKYSFEIMNILGDVIMRGELEGKEEKIELTNLSNGSYTILFRNEKYTQTEKFIKNGD